MEAFSQAGMILQRPALRPCEHKPEVVFSNTTAGAQDAEEGLSELFDEVKDKTGGSNAVEGPDGVEITLSEGEELEETVKQRILPDPGEPTESQREDHRAGGHISFRSWCEECVAARATGEQHRKRKEARRVCIFAFDYLFLDEAGNLLEREALSNGATADLTILVAKDLKGKAVFGHVVPQKGVDAEHFAVDALLQDIKWLGYTRLGLRSDNEPAILKLLEHSLTEARLDVVGLEQIYQEHPNAYDSSGNGEIEAAVKQLTGILRTNKLDLEKRINMKVPQSHAVMSWLVVYAAWMITVRVMGEDGLTAYQRVRHRSFAKRLVSFGETVQVYLQPKGPERRAAGALDARTKVGVVLGYATETHAYMVFVDGTVRPYRSIYRLPLSRRWSAGKLQEVNVTVKDLHLARGARAVPFQERDGELGKEAPVHSRAPRKLELRQSDFDPARGGFGWTEHCSKCMRAKDYGWKQAANSQHSAACRARVEAELAQTEQGRIRLDHAQQRSDRWLESSVATGVQDASGEGEAAQIAADDSPPKFLPLPHQNNSQNRCENLPGSASAHRQNQVENLPGSASAPLLQPSRPEGRRGVAPPASARVQETAGDMGEDSDEEDLYAAHGNDAPMTPACDSPDYAPTSPRGSPMSMDAVSVFGGTSSRSSTCS